MVFVRWSIIKYQLCKLADAQRCTTWTLTKYLEKKLYGNKNATSYIGQILEVTSYETTVVQPPTSNLCLSIKVYINNAAELFKKGGFVTFQHKYNQIRRQIDKYGLCLIVLCFEVELDSTISRRFLSFLN